MEVKLIQETCCSEGCGIMFWLADEYRERLVSTKRSFYCPNGHSMSYQGESDKVKAIRLQAEKNTLERIQREKDAEIDRLTKKLRRKCRVAKKKK